MDDETAARFELLKIEIGNLESGVRGLDTILFQVKGWCVTVTVAVAGLARTPKSPTVLVLAAGAILGFWFVDGQHKAMQQVFIIRRSRRIEEKLATGTVADALTPGGLDIPGLATEFAPPNLTPLQYSATSSPVSSRNL